MRISINDATYFITTATKDRTAVFKSDQLIRSFADIIITACKNHKSTLYVYAILPDHYHILIQLGNKITISKLLHAINSFFSHTYGQGRIDIWERDPWDEVIRDEDMFYQKMSYILLNPWRKGLVSSPLDSSVRTNIEEIRQKQGEKFLWELFGKYHRYGE